MVGSRRDIIAASGLAAAALAVAAGTGAPARAADPPAAATSAAGPAASPDKLIDVVSLDGVEQDAKATLPLASYAFVAGGTGDEWTLRENRRAFNDVPILTERLRGVEGSTISTAVTLLGHEMSTPLLVAPMGVHLMVHKAAEAATAAGAGRAGVLYTASGASNLPLEQIAKATTGPRWFQAYLNADPGVSREILLRARNAGYSAIVFTADAIGPGTSDGFTRLGKLFPPGMTFGNNDPRYGGRGSFIAQKTALTLDDIGWIREVTGLPVVVKGLLRAKDAAEAISAGAAAVQVSNHGGRQIDGVPASITVLPDVVDAVGGRVPVIFDSGIRRGIDVFRALALGATAVGVGRPVLFGAALGGAGGVQNVLQHLNTEFRTAMLLAGVQTVGRIGRDNLLPAALHRKDA